MSESTKTKKPKVIYSVERGQGGSPSKIFREEGDQKNQIALYDQSAGIVQMVPEYANFRGRVSQFLAEEVMLFKDYAPIGTDLQIQGDPVKSIPPRPKKNPGKGTKTKAVVEWYAKYYPAVFREKYGLKELQLKTGDEVYETQIRDEQSGRMIDHKVVTPIYEGIEGFDYDIIKLKNGEQRLIADCATHLTIKMKDLNNDPDSDWDAAE